MTAADITAAGIPIENPTGTDLLMVESAVEYITSNTTLEADISDIESIKALPPSAKLFIIKYNELMNLDSGITSENLGGMSQSFSTGNNDAVLLDLLYSLLGKYVRSGFRFIPL